MTTNIESLIETLTASGWTQANDHLSGAGNETPVYLYKRTERTDLPECKCNEKPVQFVLKPFRMMFNDGTRHESWTLDLTAEALDGQWVKLQVYALTSRDLLDQLPRAIARLEAAWQAASTL